MFTFHHVVANCYSKWQNVLTKEAVLILLTELILLLRTELLIICLLSQDLSHLWGSMYY